MLHKWYEIVYKCNIFILSSVMIKEGKYILVSKLIYTALILNILANFFLIPKFELYGAIYSSIISEIYLLNEFHYFDFTVKIDH